MITPNVLVLFSGGLDSILTCKILQEQNLNVLCLHATSPFFGKPDSIAKWEKCYNLKIVHHRMGNLFIDVLKNPRHGYGKHLNPCVDCKILLLKEAKKIMTAFGAKFLATGEVVGQRPMSQRKDTLNTILHSAEVEDILLRPLSAKLFPPTLAEQQGLVQREKLYGISGRGREEQLKLAKYFNLAEIPTPSGGCRLTEEENARCYGMVLTNKTDATETDFALCNYGRQFWVEMLGQKYWFIVGRHKADNIMLKQNTIAEDCLITFPDIAAPVALARSGSLWPQEMLLKAAAHALSYANKALKQTSMSQAVFSFNGQRKSFTIKAHRFSDFCLPSWETMRMLLRQRQQAQSIHNSLHA